MCIAQTHFEVVMFRNTVKNKFEPKFVRLWTNFFRGIKNSEKKLFLISSLNQPNKASTKDSKRNGHSDPIDFNGED